MPLQRYAALLANKDLRGAILASIVGRLPIGLTGLSILLLTQGSTGSFSEGGLMTAAYIAGLATIAPWLGRRIDRVGPRPVLRLSAIAFPLALCALVLAIRLDSTTAIQLGLAFAAGASFPPITSCMRTLLRRRLGEDALLSTAYSLESVLIELIFIVGPAVVALLVAFASADSAVLLAAFCGSIGTLLFLRSTALARWRVERSTPGSVLGPLAAPGFTTLLFAVIGYASAFGFVEIGVTAYAASIGSPGLAGALLSLMSAGSALGGLAYGMRIWRAPLVRQFGVALALLGLSMALILPASNAWWFAAMSFVAGVMMAPALTIQAMLVAKLADPAQSTEAFTWSSTALLIGVAIGMALGGWAAENWGWHTAVAAASLAALASGVFAFGLRAR